MNIGLGASETTATPQPVPSAQQWLATVRAYVALTKPRIIELLLTTTLPAMLLAARGWPGLRLVLATLLGGYLAAGGAGAINCYLDRDLDQLMSRTRRRPLVTGQVSPGRALLFGVLLGVLAFGVFALWVNLLAAVLAEVALLFYVLVYTLLLKRSTPQNIVIGGAAGAMPPLIGWAAVTGSISPAAVVLFGLIFLWTPPHFWALALRYREDYARAGVPMLPVVRGEAETTKQILCYSVLVVLASLLLLATGAVGLGYGLTAAVLGGGFVWLAWRLQQRPSPRAALGLFKYSIYYLALLFGSMAVDVLLQHVAGRGW